MNARPLPDYNMHHPPHGRSGAKGALTLTLSLSLTLHYILTSVLVPFAANLVPSSTARSPASDRSIRSDASSSVRSVLTQPECRGPRGATLEGHVGLRPMSRRCVPRATSELTTLGAIGPQGVP